MLNDAVKSSCLITAEPIEILRLIDPVYFYRHVYSACFAVHQTKLPLE